jgi:hypothetical protein
MEDATPPGGATLEAATEEGVRLVDAARGRGLALRLLGGVAVWVRCPSARRPPLARAYADVDFIVPAGSTGAVTAFFADQGYQPNRRFNALHGARRLAFADPLRGRPVDVLVDEFSMCHRIDLRGRIALDDRTLTLADLLLTKLQIVELNEKDLKDLLALLVDHGLDGGDPDPIDAARVVALTRDDWGLDQTVRLTLARVSQAAATSGLAPDAAAAVVARADGLLRQLEVAPKTLRWRLRARVGRRVRWYELPEEVRR